MVQVESSNQLPGKIEIQQPRLEKPVVFNMRADAQIDLRPDGDAVQAYLTLMTGKPTVPYVFANGEFVGGSEVLHSLLFAVPWNLFCTCSHSHSQASKPIHAVHNSSVARAALGEEQKRLAYPVCFPDSRCLVLDVEQKHGVMLPAQGAASTKQVQEPSELIAGELSSMSGVSRLMCQLHAGDYRAAADWHAAGAAGRQGDSHRYSAARSGNLSRSSQLQPTAALPDTSATILSHSPTLRECSNTYLDIFKTAQQQTATSLPLREGFPLKTIRQPAARNSCFTTSSRG